MSKKRKNQITWVSTTRQAFYAFILFFSQQFCDVNIYLFPLFDDFVQGHKANDRQNLNSNSG